jgi:hypothetical protein
MEAPETRTYILECTQNFFVGQTDEPCSGAARLEPTNSRAAPLRSAASTAVLHSIDHPGANPPASAMAEDDPWPPPATRET